MVIALTIVLSATIIRTAGIIRMSLTATIVWSLQLKQRQRQHNALTESAIHRSFVVTMVSVSKSHRNATVVPTALERKTKLNAFVMRCVQMLHLQSVPQWKNAAELLSSRVLRITKSGT